jgi:hypothetical protein
VRPSLLNCLHRATQSFTQLAVCRAIFGSNPLIFYRRPTLSLLAIILLELAIVPEFLPCPDAPPRFAVLLPPAKLAFPNCFGALSSAHRRSSTSKLGRVVDPLQLIGCEGFGDFHQFHSLRLGGAVSLASSSRMARRRNLLKSFSCVSARVRRFCERYNSLSYWSDAISHLNSKTRWRVNASMAKIYALPSVVLASSCCSDSRTMSRMLQTCWDWEHNLERRYPP